MKKSFIALIAVCIAVIMILSACGGKTAITADKFKEKARAAGMSAEDSNGIFAGADTVSYAEHPDGWTMDFIKYKSIETAKISFDFNIESFAGGGIPSSEKKESSENHSIYEAERDEDYVYICRIGDTMISTRTTTDKKDSVKEFVKTIGY